MFPINLNKYVLQVAEETDNLFPQKKVKNTVIFYAQSNTKPLLVVSSV